VDVAALKAQWTGFSFDRSEFEVRQEDTLAFARACGEQDPRFLEPAHPEFQAPPTFPARFVSRQVLPKGFPRIGRGMFDAGKCVFPKAPIRPGETLVAHSRIEDLYEKTGRSGPMIFLVHRMEFENPRQQPVSVVDWRLVLTAGAVR